MKEAALVGLLCGIMVFAAFVGGTYYGKSNAVVQTCSEGQLYVGVGPVGDMLVAEVVYPLDKARCKSA